MQIVSNGDNLYEMSNSVFWKNKKKYFKMSSAENFTQIAKRKCLTVSTVLSASLEDIFAGILFQMKVFVIDILSGIICHFCFCSLFSNIYPKINFMGYKISSVKLNF